MVVPEPVTWHWVLGWVFDALFLGSGIGIVVFGLKSRALALRSRPWPKAPGKIVSSTVAEQGGNDGSAYRAEIVYAYEAGGMFYSGKRIRAGYWLYASGSGARRTVERYPAGMAVEVAHDPADPASSLLEPGETGSAWLVVVFGGLFVAMGTLFGVLYALYPDGHTWHGGN